MTTLFISDLHLDATRPGITGQFIEFLRSEARAARALYILGDLFEIWIGDDDPDPDKRRVLDALRELTRAGVPCYFMHGNRDFLIGRRFAERTGVELLEDGTLVEVDGRRALLMHGDVLCTDDRSYQRLRRIVRNPLIKFIFKRLSLKRRSALAERIRAGSRDHTDRTPAPIMDVNARAVDDAMARHGVDLLIHGHTHRPAVHRLALPGGEGQRIVLGDWYEHGSVLRAQDGRFDLAAMPRPDQD